MESFKVGDLVELADDWSDGIVAGIVDSTLATALKALLWPARVSSVSPDTSHFPCVGLEGLSWDGGKNFVSMRRLRHVQPPGSVQDKPKTLAPPASPIRAFQVGDLVELVDGWERAHTSPALAVALKALSWPVRVTDCLGSVLVLEGLAWDGGGRTAEHTVAKSRLRLVSCGTSTDKAEVKHHVDTMAAFAAHLRAEAKIAAAMVKLDTEYSATHVDAEYDATHSKTAPKKPQPMRYLVAMDVQRR